MSTPGESTFGDDAVLVALLQQAKAGDEAAVEQLFHRLYPFLLLCAREELDAELRTQVRESDLVQQSCLEAHRDFPRLSSNSVDGLFDWLMSILRANAADMRRRIRARQRHGMEPEFSLDDSRSSQAITARQNLFDVSPAESETSAENSPEADSALDRALDRLPEDYRAVILFRHQDKLTFAEIGERTNRSPDAARMHWKRAVKRLQEELGGSSESSES